jgi:hypothetical protein
MNSAAAVHQRRRLRVHPGGQAVSPRFESLGRKRSQRPGSPGRSNGGESTAVRPLATPVHVPAPAAAPGPADRRASGSDLFDDRLLQDRCDELQITAAVRAALKVAIKDALEQPRPSHQLACSKPALHQCPVMARLSAARRIADPHIAQLMRALRVGRRSQRCARGLVPLCLRFARQSRAMTLTLHWHNPSHAHPPSPAASLRRR